MRSLLLRCPALLLALVACVPGARGEDVPRPPTARPGAHVGGTLRVAITPPDGIDPAGTHEPSGALIAATMCDQLIAFDPVTGEPRPSLAESWTVTDGGGALFVKLRKGARFSNGAPVTADDIVFTLSRLADERFASPSASLLEPIAGYGFVHGEADTNDERLRRTLGGLQIVDSRTISIALAEPAADFFRVLGHPATSPVPREVIEREPASFARRPVCSGPYRLTTDWPTSRVILERTPNHIGVNSSLTNGGGGYAERIEFDVVASRAAAVRAFRRGRVDLAPVPNADTRGAPEGARVLRAPSSQTEFVGLVTTKPPFTDARVRRALSRALDRSALARRDGGIAARSFVAPGLGVRADACGADTPVRADLAGARAAFARAGVDPTTLRPTLTYNDEFANRKLVREVARQWRVGLGVRARLVPLRWERYRVLATNPQGIEGAFRFGWTPAYRSADRAIAPLFTVNAIGKDNWSRYSSRDLDDALRAARKAAEPRDRARILERAESILCEDMPMIPIVRGVRAYLIRNTLASAATSSATQDAQSLLRELFVV